MDKKDVNDFVQAMVEEVASANGIGEKAARAFVGTMLIQSRDELMAAITMPKARIGSAEVTV